MDNLNLSSQGTGTQACAPQPQQQPTGCCIWPRSSDGHLRAMDNLKLPSQDPPAPQPQQQQPTGCCIWPNGTDSLVLISFPRDLLAPFRLAVQTSWIKGIQLEGYLKGPQPREAELRNYVIKLRGNPWNRGQLNRCYLIKAIMQFMLLRGWGLELSMTPTEFCFSHQGSWFFRKQSPEMHVTMCSISCKITGFFSAIKRVRVIDGSEEVNQVVYSTIKNHWYGKYLKQKTVDSSVQEFNLSFPCRILFYQTQAREFLMHLLVALRSSGWILYASVPSSYMTGNHSMEQEDTWILKRVKS